MNRYNRKKNPNHYGGYNRYAGGGTSVFSRISSMFGGNMWIPLAILGGIVIVAVFVVFLVLHEGKDTALKSELPAELGEVSYSGIDPSHIAQTPDGVMFLDNELMLVAAEGADRADINKVARRYKAEIVGAVDLTGDYQLRVGDAHSLRELSELADSISSEEAVAECEISYVFEQSVSTVRHGSEWSGQTFDDSTIVGRNNTPVLNWNMNSINWEAAKNELDGTWHRTENEGKVGLLDTVFDTEHEDLQACFVKTFHNNLTSFPDNHTVEDTVSLHHGTHVAGIMAADGQNDGGICGVYPYGRGNLYGVSYYGLSGGASEYINGDAYENEVMTLMTSKVAVAELVLSDVKVINYSMGFNWYTTEDVQKGTLASSTTNAGTIVPASTCRSPTTSRRPCRLAATTARRTRPM